MVAISNGRLLDLRNGQVTFRFRDSADGNTQKLMTIEAIEFIRRFLLHVLPPGFVKIHHFGCLSNGCRTEGLTLSNDGPPRNYFFDNGLESGVHFQAATARFCVGASELRLIARDVLIH